MAPLDVQVDMDCPIAGSCEEVRILFGQFKPEDNEGSGLQLRARGEVQTLQLDALDLAEHFIAQPRQRLIEPLVPPLLPGQRVSPRSPYQGKNHGPAIRSPQY